MQEQCLWNYVSITTRVIHLDFVNGHIFNMNKKLLVHKFDKKIVIKTLDSYFDILISRGKSKNMSHVKKHNVYICMPMC